MKKKILQEYNKKSDIELRKDLVDFRGKLSDLKFNFANGKVNNLREIKEMKKNIARILTKLNQK